MMSPSNYKTSGVGFKKKKEKDKARQLLLCDYPSTNMILTVWFWPYTAHPAMHHATYCHPVC